MNYTNKVKQLLKKKNSKFQFIKEVVANGVIIRIIEQSVNTNTNRAVQGRQVNNINKLVAHISYESCDDDDSNYIYLNFIRVENDFKNTKMSKYIMAYFIGHLIEKYGQIPIQLQNATNNTIKFNFRSCKRMKTQVKALTTKSNIVLPRNSTLRSGKVRLDKNYWKTFDFKFKDDDTSEMEYTGKLTDLYNKMIDEINNDLQSGGNSYASVPNSGNAGNSGNSGIDVNSGNVGANLNNSANANNANNANNSNVINDGNNVGNNNVNDKKYIKTKNGRRKIHTGKKGGKYYIMNKKKIYIK